MEIFKSVLHVVITFTVCVPFNVLLSSPIYFKPNEVRDIAGLGISNHSYLRKRQDLLISEQLQRVGGELVLNASEKIIDGTLLKYKQKEINDSHYSEVPFAAAINFLRSKPLVEQSLIFQIIKKMPKGGALHVHDCSITDIAWLVMNVTYRDNCYMCMDANKSISFLFSQKPPSHEGCPWRLVYAYRNESGNITAFDNMLIESMVLTVEAINQDINVVWERFREILNRANGLINYAPVFTDYFYEALKEFHDDNVQYVEVRALLPQVYNLDGSVLNTTQVMGLYKGTIQRFVADFPDFSGAKIIKTNLRFFQPSDILDDIKNSIQLMQQFPDHFAGYDLVGQEDPGKPLLYYLDALLYPSQQSPPISLPYFFHAGETDWEGTVVDDNLLDAVLLNTSRIGHGYALTKHPGVMKIIKNNRIAVEVNPISNQVLKLVDNLQNHPASTLFSSGYPIVVSSDDPAVWRAKGLSYDFYVAFMALAGEDDGLKVLKQLSMNSLIYSALSKDEKSAALTAWDRKWHTFIGDVVRDILK